MMAYIRFLDLRTRTPILRGGGCEIGVHVCRCAVRCVSVRRQTAKTRKVAEVSETMNGALVTSLADTYRFRDFPTFVNKWVATAARSAERSTESNLAWAFANTSPEHRWRIHLVEQPWETSTRVEQRGDRMVLVRELPVVMWMIGPKPWAGSARQSS